MYDNVVNIRHSVSSSVCFIVIALPNMENENVKIEAPKINFNLSVPVKFDSRFLEGNANQLNLGFDY